MDGESKIDSNNSCTTNGKTLNGSSGSQKSSKLFPNLQNIAKPTLNKTSSSSKSAKVNMFSSIILYILICFLILSVLLCYLWF